MISRRAFLKGVLISGAVIPLKPSLAFFEEPHVIMHPPVWDPSWQSYEVTWSAHVKGQPYYGKMMIDNIQDKEFLDFCTRKMEDRLKHVIKCDMTA